MRRQRSTGQVSSLEMLSEAIQAPGWTLVMIPGMGDARARAALLMSAAESAPTWTSNPCGLSQQQEVPDVSPRCLRCVGLWPAISGFFLLLLCCAPTCHQKLSSRNPERLGRTDGGALTALLMSVAESAPMWSSKLWGLMQQHGVPGISPRCLWSTEV